MEARSNWQWMGLLLAVSLCALCTQPSVVLRADTVEMSFLESVSVAHDASAGTLTLNGGWMYGPSWIGRNFPTVPDDLALDALFQFDDNGDVTGGHIRLNDTSGRSSATEITAGSIREVAGGFAFSGQVVGDDLMNLSAPSAGGGGGPGGGDGLVIQVVDLLSGSPGMASVAMSVSTAVAAPVPPSVWSGILLLGAIGLVRTVRRFM